MANMFKCVIAAGSGDGASLIVTCSQNFAGKVITCTDGGEHTYQETCPSSSPYTVTFKSIPVGTYTISGVISGQTFSTTKTITNFTAQLQDIPNGATVTPVNDIQIWLHCANVWDKTYTTINQVLSDTTTLLALISSNNAADYMARSTTWASDVVANSSAMTVIGANDYCADALLSDSTWLNAICNSTYFESVLNVKVPTMTSDTTPSGKAGYTSFNGSAYQAFDGNDTSQVYTNTGVTGCFVYYKFPTARKMKLFKGLVNGGDDYITSYSIDASNDYSAWDNLYNGTCPTNVTQYSPNDILNNNNSYLYYRFYVKTVKDSSNRARVFTLQFYGR